MDENQKGKKTKQKCKMRKTIFTGRLSRKFIIFFFSLFCSYFLRTTHKQMKTDENWSLKNIKNNLKILLQLNIMKMDIAINVIQRANHVKVQQRTIVSLAPIIFSYKITNASAVAIKDSSWRLEYALNVYTPAHSVFLAWIVQNASKDCNFKVVNVVQLALMGECKKL